MHFINGKDLLRECLRRMVEVWKGRKLQKEEENGRGDEEKDWI